MECARSLAATQASFCKCRFCIHWSTRLSLAASLALSWWWRTSVNCSLVPEWFHTHLFSLEILIYKKLAQKSKRGQLLMKSYRRWAVTWQWSKPIPFCVNWTRAEWSWADYSEGIYNCSWWTLGPTLSCVMHCQDNNFHLHATIMFEFGIWKTFEMNPLFALSLARQPEEREREFGQPPASWANIDSGRKLLVVHPSDIPVGKKVL